MLAREKEYIRKFRNANSKILNSNIRTTINGKVNLHWWSTEREDGIENIGDLLSNVVCNYMLRLRNLSFETDICSTKHLYGIGSIIQGGAQNATIWGSGLKRGTDDICYLFRLTRRLDIRLVRGPKTREALKKKGFKCPEIYGDPAIIMPFIYKPRIREQKDIQVILHHESKIPYCGAITPLCSDYREFIDVVGNAKLIISSSLHGIILAEVYGVPAILLRDSAVPNLFKYEDYYYSTERYTFPIARNIDEALSMNPAEIPDFSNLQRDICATFPYDLWGDLGRETI